MILFGVKCVKNEKNDKIINFDVFLKIAKTLYTKEKVAITCTATLNKHEDIKREYKKNFVLVHRFKIWLNSPISFIKF